MVVAAIQQLGVGGGSCAKIRARRFEAIAARPSHPDDVLACADLAQRVFWMGHPTAECASTGD